MIDSAGSSVVFTERVSATMPRSRVTGNRGQQNGGRSLKWSGLEGAVSAWNVVSVILHCERRAVDFSLDMLLLLLAGGPD